jgi:protein-histidine pros-kinase
MERGDLSARMPEPELIELRRIASGFNHLAERLQETSLGQRQLAQRLLSVREEERRHLARELHDEFGQCLTSIRADAACATELARESLPELLPSTEAISRVTAHMMEALQGILHQLRPIGLETFGLRAGLEQLVRGWQQGSQGKCRYVLAVDGEIDDLPDDLAVSLYRIVQESLTNAARHGEPGEVRVELRRDARRIRLVVQDDGHGAAWHSAGSGLGVLGMHERVQALGGAFSLTPRTPHGMQVKAAFPLQAHKPPTEHHAEQDQTAAG